MNLIRNCISNLMVIMILFSRVSAVEGKVSVHMCTISFLLVSRVAFHSACRDDPVEITCRRPHIEVDNEGRVSLKQVCCDMMYNNVHI